jgi:hypothetical protein
VIDTAVIILGIVVVILAIVANTVDFLYQRKVNKLVKTIKGDE